MTGVSECSQQRGNLKDNGYTDGRNSTSTQGVLYDRFCDRSNFRFW
ncbi:hypothetical protein [Photorhabdus laumondii]